MTYFFQLKMTASTEGRLLTAALLVIAVYCSVLFVFVPPAGLAAENPKEQYQKIQKEMESHKEKLEQAKRRERSVLDDLDGMNKRLTEIESDLKKQQRRVRQTEADISRVEKEMVVARGELEKKKRWLKGRLKAMQRHGQSGDLVFLLAAEDDMAGLMRRWKYLERVSLRERKGIEEYGEILKRLDEKEKQLQGLRAELKRREEKIKLAEASLTEKKKERETLLTSVRKEKSTHEKLYRELQESAKRLLELIRKLEEKETYEGKGFPALKGNLAWPVNGKVAIPYGSQKDPKFNTPVFRNGIYIKTEDESVRAVYGGKVVFADWFKGYGNLVIINHGEGYHTLYGNLSETFFKVGDIIKGKDTIGKVGESGILNAPSLYFEVRYKGKPLDPMQWLRRR